MIDVIAVTIKNVYGEPKAYPANEQAQILADIAGTKTLTVNTLRCAEDMGFIIRRITPNVNDAMAEILGEYGVTA